MSPNQDKNSDGLATFMFFVWLTKLSLWNSLPRTTYETVEKIHHRKASNATSAPGEHITFTPWILADLDNQFININVGDDDFSAHHQHHQADPTDITLSDKVDMGTIHSGPYDHFERFDIKDEIFIETDFMSQVMPDTPTTSSFISSCTTGATPCYPANITLPDKVGMGTIHSCPYDSFESQLKSYFDTPGNSQIESLDQLADGLTRKKATQLFYHTCVMATMDYVKVEQLVPYGDISISGGSKI